MALVLGTGASETLALKPGAPAGAKTSKNSLDYYMAK